MIKDDIVKVVLCMYIVLGYFIPLNSTIVRDYKAIVVVLLISIFCSFMYDQHVYSIDKYHVNVDASSISLFC